MKENYIFPFFWLHGEDEAKLRKYVNVIKNSGCDAFCVESRPHPDFCGDKWWQDMDVIIDEAKKLDMKIWILDDSHFPTGFANGAAMKADDSLRRQSIYTHVYNIKPSQKSMNLNFKKIMKNIPSTFMSGIITKSDKDAKHVFTDDKLISVTALIAGEDKPVVIICGGDPIGEKLRLDIPEGTEKLYITFLTRNAGIHKSYMNMMNEDSCRLLIDAVYEPHFAHYGDEFGKTILGFFSDEPELGNGVYFDNNVKVGTDHDFPWSTPLEQELRKKFGEDFESYLPLIWDDSCNTVLASKVRYEYMDAVTRLVEKCFSKQIGSWCKDHDVEYIGHIIEDCNAHARTANSLGHYFRGLSGQHMAGIDDIGGQVLPFKEDAPAEGIFKMLGDRDGEFYHFMLGKLAESMAYLQPEKQGRSMCEIFGNYGWGEGPRMEKYLADHFMVQGINHFVPHAFSPKPYPDKDCPPHFYANGHNPQYRAFGEVIGYMNRICELISDGKPVLDTAILYHGEGEWAGEAMLSQKPARVLMENQIDFLLLPADVFEEEDRYHTSFENGFSVNGMQFRRLVIPYTQYIRPELASAISSLKQAGCQVIFVDALPESLIGGVPLAEEIKACSVVSLDKLSVLCEREVIVAPENKRVRAMHYKKGNQEFYYLVNEDDSAYKGTITVPEVQTALGYDAWSNKLLEINYKNEAEKTIVNICLKPSESIILFLNDRREAEEKTLYQQIDELKNEQDLSSGMMLSTCKAIEYPKFSLPKPIDKLQDYAKANKKFSGYIAYEKSFQLEKNADKVLLVIEDAGEDVEVFVNGTSLGIQILPPFIYDISEAACEGENKLRIEVATTLERERGANKKKQAPIGICGDVYLLF